MIHSQITWHTKNQENEAHSQEEREWTTSDPEMKQMLKLTDKDFMTVLTIICNELKENIFKQWIFQ